VCADGKPCRDRAGFRRRVLRACRFPPASQTAEHVDFPARADVHFVGAARAVEIGRSGEHLSQRCLHRLVDLRAERAHLARGKQRRTGHAQCGARLRDTCRCLRELQVLFEGQRDEARQRRIIEASPPALKVRLALDRPSLDTFLAKELWGQRNLRRFVARADRAAGQEADTEQEGGRAGVGEHIGPFGDLNGQ